MVNTMELYQLRSFLEVARIQNLTRAAQRLNISQSALSSQIKLLEEELQLQLFLRTPRGMFLTEHGHGLHSYALETVASADVLRGKARELAGQTTPSTLKIGLNTDGVFLKVSRLSRRLVADFSDTNFVFVSSQTIRNAEMLRQGLIDIGFFFGGNYDHDIHSQVIGQVSIRVAIPRVLLAGLDGPVTWAKLAALPWIWSVCDCPFYQIVQAEMDILGLTPNIVVDAMDENVVKELVLDNQGIAILREDDAQEVAGRGDILVWPDFSAPVELRLGMLKSNAERSDLRAIVAIVLLLWPAENPVEPTALPETANLMLT